MAGGYPPDYAQPVHRLPNVIQRTLIRLSLNVTDWHFLSYCPGSADLAVDTRGLRSHLRSMRPGRVTVT